MKHINIFVKFTIQICYQHTSKNVCYESKFPTEQNKNLWINIRHSKIISAENQRVEQTFVIKFYFIDSYSLQNRFSCSATHYLLYSTAYQNILLLAAKCYYLKKKKLSAWGNKNAAENYRSPHILFLKFNLSYIRFLYTISVHCNSLY